MELTEPIESINSQLVESFGIDTISGLPMWRVIFSEDELEKRLGTYEDFTPAGIFLRTVTEVREVPKYSQYIKERYILERLTVIPDMNQPELPTQKLSYEPMWTFETNKGDYLPPRFDACKFVVDAVYAALGKSSLAKYKDPEEGANPEEAKAQRVDRLHTELFGNESPVGSALARGDAVSVPHTYISQEGRPN